MSTVRAKFYVASITKSAWAPGQEPKSATIVLSPVPFDHKNPQGENSKFWEASPSGKLEMNVTNPAAIEQFTVGQEYYLDFIPVPAPQA